MKHIATNSISNSKGFTLIELMVGIAVSLIVLAGVTSVFVGTVKSSGDTLKASKLNQDMQAIMGIMVADIRRAGYWNSLGLGPTATNLFTTVNTIDTDADGFNECILYSYDKSLGGTTDGVVQNAERFGFKLSNSDVWMRTTGTDVTNCADLNDTWQRLNDEGIEEITELSFAPFYKCVNADNGETVPTNCDTSLPLASPPLPTGTVAGNTLVETRHVKISMTGRLISDINVTKKIDASVRVRNDRIFTAP